MSENLEKELKRLRDERQKKFNEEDWEGALEIHDQILKLSPSALRYANRGSILYRLGALEDAIESYRKALEMDPSLKRARADLERLEAQLQKKQGKKVTKAYTPQDKSMTENDKQSKINEYRDKRQKYLEKEEWEEGLKWHDKILALEPTALRYANQGSILYRLGKLQDAIHSYKKALEMDPELSRAKLDLERLESQMEEEKLLDASHKDPNKDIQDKIESLRKERQEKINQEKWDDAITLHDEILELEPTALRYANKGALLYRVGKIQEALGSYKKALEMDSSLDRVRGDIARLEAQMEEHELLSLGESEGQEEELSTEEKNKKINELRDERQEYLDKKDWEKALEIHDEIIKIEPTALRYVNRGSMLYRMKHLEEAIESYNIALQLDPNLGRAKKDLERMKKELAKLPPKHVSKPVEMTLEEKVDDLKKKRQNMVEQEQWEKALGFHDEILKLEPTALRYANRGSILYRMERVNDAILSYRKALDMDETLDRARDDLNRLKDNEMDRLRQERQEMMMNEDWRGALEIHDVILALEANALRYANRGSLLYRMDRFGEAMEAYQKALELEPDLEKAKEDLQQLKEEMHASVVMTAVPAEFEEDEEDFLIVEEAEIEEEVEEEIEEEIEEDEEYTGICKVTLEGHEKEITEVVITADEKYLVSASKDNTIKIWDTKDNKCKHTLKGHEDWVRAIAISKDGKNLISGSDDWTVKVWDIESGECEVTLEGHTMPITAVGITPNKRYIFSGSRDKTIKVWDFKTRKNTTTLEGHEDWVNNILITQDGNKVISGSCDGVIKIWNLLGWRCVNTIKVDGGWINSLKLTEDGKQIVSMGEDNIIQLWSVNSEDCIKTFYGHNDNITDVSIMNNVVATSGRDQCVMLWDTESLEQKNILKGDLSRFTKVEISSDRNFVFSGSDDSRLWIWDLKNNNKSHVFEEHKASITCFKNIPEKKLIASGSKDSTIKLWDYSLLID